MTRLPQPVDSLELQFWGRLFHFLITSMSQSSVVIILALFRLIWGTYISRFEFIVFFCDNKLNVLYYVNDWYFPTHFGDWPVLETPIFFLSFVWVCSGSLTIMFCLVLIFNRRSTGKIIQEQQCHWWNPSSIMDHGMYQKKIAARTSEKKHILVKRIYVYYFWNAHALIAVISQ